MEPYRVEIRRYATDPNRPERAYRAAQTYAAALKIRDKARDQGLMADIETRDRGLWWPAHLETGRPYIF